MDDPAFMFLQLQENLRFVNPGARVLLCMVSDENRVPYWTYVILAYDDHRNVQRYLDPYDSRQAKWTIQPLEALKKMHLDIAAQATDLLIHDNHRPLRRLEQQRCQEAAERAASSASNNPEGSRRGAQQPLASTSASRQASERPRSQISDNPPAYQSQETSSAHVQRSGRLPTRDTLNQANRVSSSRPRKIQGFDGTGRAGSPVHLPLKTSPTNTLVPGDRWSPGDAPAGEGWRYQTSETAHRDHFRSTRSQPRTSGSSMNASSHGKAKADPHTSRVNDLPGPSRPRVHQSQPLNPRAATFSNPSITQPPIRNDRPHPPRPTNDHLPQGIHGMRTLHPSTTTNPLHQIKRPNTLPEILSSAPAYRGASQVPLLLPASTFNLMDTDPQEFLRRAEVHRREQFGPHDILAPIGDSASEFARLDGADLDGVDGGGDGVGDGDVSLTTRMLGHRPQSRRSSGSSGETVRASKSLHRRRRVTQRRYGDNETADPLPPPAAPSPRPNDVCPANLPVYPPTLINSVSGASVRRNAGNAAQGNAASRISSSSESQSMRRPTPLGARSVSSVSRQGEFDGRHGDSENERLLGEEQRGGYRRVSQNHEGDQGQANPPPPPSPHRSYTSPFHHGPEYRSSHRTYNPHGLRPHYPFARYARFDRPFDVRDWS